MSGNFSDQLPPFQNRPPREERWNAVTHGVGAILSFLGGVFLVYSASKHGDSLRTLGCVIFAVSLVVVYLASTLSHSLKDPRRKQFFAVLDQATIYLLIAGTYTPFALTYLRGGWWWLLWGAMWVLALAGFVTKFLYYHRIRPVAVWTYVALGWLPVVGTGAYLSVAPWAALAWVLAGGLCYTVGTFFLVNDKKRPSYHAAWHVMVMAGSSCHFFAVYRFVACYPIAIG